MATTRKRKSITASAFFFRRTVPIKQGYYSTRMERPSRCPSVVGKKTHDAVVFYELRPGRCVVVLVVTGHCFLLSVAVYLCRSLFFPYWSLFIYTGRCLSIPVAVFFMLVAIYSHLSLFMYTGRCFFTLIAAFTLWSLFIYTGRCFFHTGRYFVRTSPCLFILVAVYFILLLVGFYLYWSVFFSYWSLFIHTGRCLFRISSMRGFSVLENEALHARGGQKLQLLLSHLQEQ